jgi:metal-sulfur cluster biosynthetic enzyme
VDMGLIESVHVDGERATVQLVLTSGWCPFSVDLLTTVRKRVEELGIEDPSIEIRWDRGWSTDRMEERARAKLRLLPDPHLVKDRDRYVASHVAHGATKGGAGP